MRYIFRRRTPYTVSLVSWHTPKRIHQAVFVPSQVFFVSPSRCATDGCANSLYFFITKQVCHRRVCQLSFFFLNKKVCHRICISKSILSVSHITRHKMRFIRTWSYMKICVHRSYFFQLCKTLPLLF